MSFSMEKKYHCIYIQSSSFLLNGWFIRFVPQRMKKKIVQIEHSRFQWQNPANKSSDRDRLTRKSIVQFFNRIIFAEFNAWIVANTFLFFFSRIAPSKNIIFCNFFFVYVSLEINFRLAKQSLKKVVEKYIFAQIHNLTSLYLFIFVCTKHSHIVRRITRIPFLNQSCNSVLLCQYLYRIILFPSFSSAIRLIQSKNSTAWNLFQFIGLRDRNREHPLSQSHSNATHFSFIPPSCKKNVYIEI